MAFSLRSIFGFKSKEELSAPPPSTRGYSSGFQGGSENTARAQLVQVVMRDLLRSSGIPPGWIICQPQVLNSKSRGSGIFIRLAVKHWDDRLMQYAFAFQKALLTDIVRFEPKAASWLHGIAWQLEVASTCPHTVLPAKDFWLEAPAPAVTWQPHPPRPFAPQTPPLRQPLVVPMTATASPSSPTSPVSQSAPAPAAVTRSTADSEAEQDLLRFFAVRDNELAQHAASVVPPVDYQRTEPSPLRNN